MTISLRIFFFVAFCLVSLQIHAQKTTAKPTEPATPKIKSMGDSVQYALGAYLGHFLFNNGFYTIDPNFLLAGLEDVYKNRPRQIADSLQLPLLNAYQQATVKQRGKQLETQLFNALKDKEGIGKLPSGVQYSILKKGKGPRASEMDSVVFNSKGVLADGTVFEDTYASKVPILAIPSLLVPGLSEAIQLMPEGSVWQIFIPSSQAYGEKGNGKNIPPNSAIQVIVELLLVKRK